MNQTNILLESGTNELEVIVFTIDVEKAGKKTTNYYGINASKVREIIRIPEITGIPNQSTYMKGLFKLRNKVIPVVDLIEFLFNRKSDYKKCKMIITEFNKMQIGFIVDNVLRINRFSWKDVDAPDLINNFDSNSSVVTGIIRAEDRNILMVDFEKIIADINPRLGIEEHVKASDFSGKDFTIVTAEDSATIRKMILDRLKIDKYNTVSFNNGQETWKHLSSVAEKHKNEDKDIFNSINLIITDIEMPQMDGLALTKKIKEHEILYKVPVIIFSSLVSEDLMHKGKSVGADAQLTKPKIGILLDTIKKLLKETKQI